jgi:hypothetical protein
MKIAQKYNNNALLCLSSAGSIMAGFLLAENIRKQSWY